MLLPASGRFKGFQRTALVGVSSFLLVTQTAQAGTLWYYCYVQNPPLSIPANQTIYLTIVFGGPNNSPDERFADRQRHLDDFRAMLQEKYGVADNSDGDCEDNEDRTTLEHGRSDKLKALRQQQSAGALGDAIELDWPQGRDQ